MKQDLTQIITTAVFELRRAWKIYSNLQKYLLNSFKLLEPNAEEIYGTTSANYNLDDGDEINDDIDEHSMPINDSQLNLHSVKSLLASVSFGYGCVQLCFSFLQQNVLKLLKFIGESIE